MAAPVPELTTFGSVLRYAIELEAASSAFYEAAVPVLRDDGLSALARELAAQHANRARLLERTRQLKLNEMVLEPISGLDGTRYTFDATPAPRDLVLPRGTALEGTAERFYRESAAIARSLLVEAARTFVKLAEENVRNAERLRDASG
jgi:rubrerythrin